MLDEEEGDGARVLLEGLEIDDWVDAEVWAGDCEGRWAVSCELLTDGLGWQASGRRVGFGC